jgi:NTE family protein
VAVRILLAPILSAPRLVGFRPYDGLYFGSPWHKYLASTLPPDKRNIENMSIPYAAVAINLLDGHPYAIRKGDLSLAMQASSAVPALRKPVEFNGKLFVDGGVLANVPVPHARQLGGDIVIAVQVDERFHPAPTNDFRKVGSVTQRMVTLQLAALDSFYERGADIVIHPNVDGISLISTKKSDAKKGVEAGEIAGKAAIPTIKAKLEQVGLALTQQQTR